MDGIWSQTEINRLIEMVLDGASAREIADDIGTTRNAVIGKARRNGIEWPGVVKVGRKPEKARVKIKKAVEKKPKKTKESTIVPDNIFVPGNFGDGCMYHSDERGWCNATPKPHSDYCPYHHGVVYRKHSSVRVYAQLPAPQY